MSHADMKFLTVAVWAAAALFFGLFLFLPNPASSKTINVCGYVAVPTKAGKCTWQTIRRSGKKYKVRICL